MVGKYIISFHFTSTVQRSSFSFIRRRSIIKIRLLSGYGILEFPDAMVYPSAGFDITFSFKLSARPKINIYSATGFNPYTLYFFCFGRFSIKIIYIYLSRFNGLYSLTLSSPYLNVLCISIYTFCYCNAFPFAKREVTTRRSPLFKVYT